MNSEIQNYHCLVGDDRKCTLCGHEFTIGDPPFRRRCPQATGKPRKKREPPRALACVHRGETLRLQSCPGCKGTVSLKVDACALHGECSLANIDGVKFCKKCPDLTGPPELVKLDPETEPARGDP
jgi:hypothetical protein